MQLSHWSSAMALEQRIDGHRHRSNLRLNLSICRPYSALLHEYWSTLSCTQLQWTRYQQTPCMCHWNPSGADRNHFSFWRKAIQSVLPGLRQIMKRSTSNYIAPCNLQLSAAGDLSIMYVYTSSPEPFLCTHCCKAMAFLAPPTFWMYQSY